MLIAKLRWEIQVQYYEITWRCVADDLLPRSYDSDSGAGSIIDPAFQNRSGFHELHYENNYIYEELQK